MEKKDIHLLSDEDDTLSDKENEFVSEGIIINEVQLLLAEKRTSLATMRTGITVFVLPLSVICVALVLLGSYLIVRAVIRMRHQDSLIMKLKRKHRWIAEYID